MITLNWFWTCCLLILPLAFETGHCNDEPPRMQQITALDALREGQRFRVACNVISGSIPLQITWTKNDSPLINQDRLQIRKLSEEISELIINSVTMEDSGNYSCLAKNSKGTDISNVEVEIQGKKNQFVYLLITLD